MKEQKKPLVRCCYFSLQIYECSYFFAVANIWRENENLKKPKFEFFILLNNCPYVYLAFSKDVNFFLFTVKYEVQKIFETWTWFSKFKQNFEMAEIKSIVKLREESLKISTLPAIVNSEKNEDEENE